MDELKLQYNELLKRYEKAALYMDNDNIPIPKREKRLDELINLVKQFQPLLDQIGVYTQNEVLEGFKIDTLKEDDKNHAPLNTGNENTEGQD